jgi:hypothetical protein
LEQEAKKEVMSVSFNKIHGMEEREQKPKIREEQRYKKETNKETNK